jgi:hypothetical protein
MEGGPWYATREMVKGASDIRETAGLDAAVDRHLDRCARDAESLLGWKHFYPLVTTRYFDWPNRQLGDPWNLWLGDSPLHSLTAVTSGGDALTVGTDVLLEPVNDGPPYTCVRINSSSSAAWSTGASNFQRALALTGLWSHGNRTQSGVTLTAAIADADTTTIDVSNSAPIGVGDLVIVDIERCVVTSKLERDTGVNTTGSLASERNARALSVPDGTAFAGGEVLTIDAESVRVDRVVGNTLVVTRAWDGTTLAAHNTNSDIYAPRRLVVSRGFGGTTAAAHNNGSSVLRWIPPASLTSLVLAEAQNAVAQENSSWARVIGAGEAEREAFAKGLVDLRKSVRRTLARNKARKAVI